MRVIGLRYFNVFGPRQDPNGPYAAAIPLFMKALMHDEPAVIHGDGEQTRDFTYVDNAVQANIRALCCDRKDAFGKVFNVAVGENVSVNRLYALLAEAAGKRPEARHTGARPGDVRNSLADISAAEELLGYRPGVRLQEGLQITFDWFRKNFV
jgi:UDP-N-acetylglucosamine 4-epimerase